MSDVITGLTHLEAEVVSIVGRDVAGEDLTVQTDKTVASGSITLDDKVIFARIGLAYTDTMKPVRPGISSRVGTIQNRAHRVFRVALRLHKSLGGKVDAQPLVFQVAGDPMDVSPPRFTGDKRITITGWDRNGQFTVTQDQPYPLTVLSLISSIRIGS